MSNELIDNENVKGNETEDVRLTDLRENALEWYTGDNIITVTLSQKRLINKIKKMAQEFPDEVKIDCVNDEGTVLAHIPLSYLKITRPREISEEQRIKARERFNQILKKEKTC